MKRRLLAVLLLFVALLSICSCSNDSTFSIRFIDVGQGDAALVECDGHYMLIDGGNKTAGQRVYDILKDEGIQRLDILVVSHYHEDHFGGLIKALTYASSIGQTICVSAFCNLNAFYDFQHQLYINDSDITVPSVGDEYDLGSATVEVVDVGGEEPNDSLVLLVTYGKTTFLFTGDIEERAQERILKNKISDHDVPINLMKMPHHGEYAGKVLDRFLEAFEPAYVVISVGKNNQYKHPDQDTLDLLGREEWEPEVYRTDRDGDIVVKSNGKEIEVKPAKELS